MELSDRQIQKIEEVRELFGDEEAEMLKRKYLTENDDSASGYGMPGQEGQAQSVPSDKKQNKVAVIEYKINNKLNTAVDEKRKADKLRKKIYKKESKPEPKDNFIGQIVKEEREEKLGVLNGRVELIEDRIRKRQQEIEILQELLHEVKEGEE